EDSFQVLRNLTTYFSNHLLLHCVFNLLDNAAKYSMSESEITIRGAYDDNTKRFTIAVSNQIVPNGHRIEPKDRKRLKERGVRGDRALVTTAGGRGIGLWIVEKFMLAMRGELMILPTDSRNRNVFLLSFPRRKPKGTT
ncbi:MAG: ATP-binding protein, partial [Acidobacteria bacterium]|nr:ATP-binding protein [Acidobacteriota bacterium]